MGLSGGSGRSGEAVWTGPDQLQPVTEDLEVGPKGHRPKPVGRGGPVDVGDAPTAHTAYVVVASIRPSYLAGPSPIVSLEAIPQLTNASNAL